MLKNLNASATNPSRVVVLGGGGFIGNAIFSRFEKSGIAVETLGRQNFDLLSAEADQKLATFLLPDDTLVFVSAKAPCRNTAGLIENLQMAHAVIAALKQQKISHLIYISSDAVYRDSDGPINEYSCAEPGSIHGAMHLAREVALKSELDLPIAIIRPTLVYGLKDPHNGYGPNSFRRIAIKNEDITLFGEGEELRDHVYVDDIAQLVYLVACYKSIGVANAVSGHAVSFRQLAEFILSQNKSFGAIRPTVRAGKMPHNGYREFKTSIASELFSGFRFRGWVEGLSEVHQGQSVEQSGFMTKPTIGFVGMTHLGLVSGVAASQKGFKIICFDIDQTKITDLLSGKLPVSEPQLEELIRCNSDHLFFTANPKDLTECDVIYVAPDVGTDNHGQSDLSVLNDLLDVVFKVSSLETTIVILSQAPPGFTRKQWDGKRSLYYQVETLIFGRAVERALFPERYIIGCSEIKDPLPRPYKEFLDAHDCPILKMRYESAELAKISINMCLVASVSVANTMAELCEKIGANWSEIVPALKLDKRIGNYSYLLPGLGISGGNLERDLDTVRKFSSEYSTDASIVHAWISNSEHRKRWPVDKLKQLIELSPQSSMIAIWGLSYKEDTDSTKNSPALMAIHQLSEYSLQVFDPAVSWRSEWHSKTTVCTSPIEALDGADALLILTPWPMFKDYSPDHIAHHLKGRLVIDPYNILSRSSKVGLDIHVLGKDSFI
jgi:UDPglucose 6-dehydrogenase